MNEVKKLRLAAGLTQQELSVATAYINYGPRGRESDN